MNGNHKLRILIANERAEHLETLAVLVRALGHEVIALELDVEAVGAETARVRPDLAMVGLGKNSGHALELISEIVREAFCPVIALLGEYDAEWVTHAANRGVYAYIVGTRPDELQGSIDVTLRRYAELQDARGAFDTRNAEFEREAELTRGRQQQLLELHDNVVQGLVAAHLALELDRGDESREALLDVLENARDLVTRSLEDLRSEGVPLEQLIKAAVPRPAQ
jgi:AmiR/NasT family two-component response regulator